MSPPPDAPAPSALPQPGVLNFLRYAGRNVVAASPQLQGAAQAAAGLQRLSSRRRRARPAEPRPPAYAATPSPYANPALWDSLELAGLEFVGVARVTGEAGVKLDVAKAAGRDGGTIRDKGYELAKVRMLLVLWDEECWASWDAILPVIDPRRQLGRRTPVDVFHPALQQRAIARVYVEKIGFPVTRPDGTIEVTIDALEFHPPSARGNASHRAAAPDLGANRTAFTGLEAPPPGVPAPSTTPAIGPDE